LDKPFIGVCNSCVDIIPDHKHLNEVAQAVKKAMREAGGVPFEFNFNMIGLMWFFYSEFLKY